MPLPSTVHVFSQGVESDDYPEITEGSQIHTDAGRARPIHTPGHGPGHHTPGHGPGHHTPGHAPGHVSLHLPEEGVLFSGDALHAPEGDLDGPRFPMEEDEAWASMERLAEREFDQTITQHGGHVEEGTEAVQAALDARGAD